jgi:ABC-type transporter Mla MlaB component
MFRLTQTEEGNSTVLVVEGDLTEPALAPLGELLRTLRADLVRSRPLILDLMGVTSIDAGGKDLLKHLHASGATFRAKGCLNRAIVEGITCCSPEPAGAGTSPDQQEVGGKRGGDK